MLMTEKDELDRAVERVQSSTSQERLVIASPGAGKTFLFKTVLERTPGDSKTRLVLTLINELRDDLERNPSELAGVYTLHGYCHYLLRHNPALSVGLTADSLYYCPNLPTLIKRNWEIVKGREAPQFVGLMRDLQFRAETDFYLTQSDYYDAIGYDDSLFRVYTRLSEDPGQMTQYDLILIDEFQDFNRLESSLVDILTSASPVLIAGDNDQALL